MLRLKTNLVEQRWHFVVLALLLERVGTVSRSRGARHDEAGGLTEHPTNGFPVIQTKSARTWADRATRVPRAVQQATRGKLPRAPDPERSDEPDLTTVRKREMNSTTSERRRNLSIDDRTRGGLLALAVAVSVGIHVGLTPEHMREMPRLGYSFIVAAVLGTVIAAALVSRPTDRRIAALAGFFCLAEILAWVLFVTIRVPFFPGTPEPVEAIAIVSKVVEAVGWVLALGLLGPREAPSPAGATGAYRATTSSFSPTSAPISPSSLKALIGRSLTASASPLARHKVPPAGRS